MNITLRQLRSFVSIGNLGGFTRAANALHATQPALSAQINQLEESLGVRLFDRSTRSVTLTQIGRDLLPVIDKVLTDLQAVAARARDISQKNTGRVTVAALPSISSTLLPRAIADFHKSFPGISIGLKDALAERIVDMTGSSSKIVYRPLPSDDPLQRCPDITRAREWLRWQPKVPLQQGLESTIRYFDRLLSRPS